MSLHSTSLKQCVQGNKTRDFLPIVKGVYYFILSYLTSLIHVKNSIIANIFLAFLYAQGKIQHAWLPW